MESGTAISEIKRRLQGKTDTFQGEVLWHGPGELVLLYRFPDWMSMWGVDLPPRSFTLAYYWEARSYNVYHTFWPDGRLAFIYCNVADQTEIKERRISWRDLIVDVLVLPGQPPRLLDEDELEMVTDAALLTHIRGAQRELLAALPTLLPWLEEQSARYVAALLHPETSDR